MVTNLIKLCLSRIENRTICKPISFCQSGFGENAWIRIEPLSTTNFSWEDPYGQKFIDVMVDSVYGSGVWKLDLEKTGLHSAENEELGLKFHVVEMGVIKVAWFTDDRTSRSNQDEEIRCMPLAGNWGHSHVQSKMQNNASPLELIIELGVIGISVVDHRPKEVSYLYFERVFVSYSTGYDGGTTSR